jgi:hypothetical protein
LKGEYDIVYFANCGEILGRTSIVVKEVLASIIAPAQVIGGESFKLKYTGPKNTEDYLSIVKKGATKRNGDFDYFYTVNDPELIAPEELGEYDIIYWLDGKKELARTTFTVINK